MFFISSGIAVTPSGSLSRTVATKLPEPSKLPQVKVYL
jgi:hypothetical protein